MEKSRWAREVEDQHFPDLADSGNAVSRVGPNMPPTRRPIINLRDVIQAREPLVVDIARIGAIESDTRRFLRLLAAWVDVHKRELGEYEERHISSVQQSTQNARLLKTEIDEKKTAVEELLGCTSSSIIPYMRHSHTALI